MSGNPAVPHRLPLARRATAATCAAVLGIGGLAAASLATASPAAARQRPSTLQSAVDATVAAGIPGYVARVDDGRRVTVAVAGVADRATGRRLAADDQFEIGSNTKTVVATIALQLVAEHRLRLTDSVERWLPGVVPNGSRITVRNLLQHTSGLYNYTNDTDFLQRALADLTAPWAPEQLVAVATKHAPSFAPGKGWEYSNTNYILVGMILQRVTGKTPAALVQERIARPLGLHRTYLSTGAAPYTGPGYAHGYAMAFTGTTPTYTDTSSWNLGGWAGTAGAIVSTPTELSRFVSALLGGRLLPPAQLAQMKSTVPISEDFGVKGGYGLGLMRVDTPCGTVWGHGGDTTGHHSTAVASEDGRRTAVADATAEPDPRVEPGDAMEAVLATVQGADLTTICTMNHRSVPVDAVKTAA